MASNASSLRSALGRRRSCGKLSMGLTIIAIAAGIAVAGCGGSGTSKANTTSQEKAPSGPIRQGGTLIFARYIEPISIDPTTGQSDTGSEETDIQIYDQLVENLPGSPNVVPGLAKSWTVSPDGLTYTFHLRNARFSNGEPVTSADVTFTWSLLLNEKHDTSFGSFFSFVKSVDAEGPSTVVFHLKSQTPAFLAYLSFPIPSIVPKAYYQKVGPSGFAQHPIGSGAFKLISWQHGQQIVLERNPYYWRKGEPHFDKVILNYVPNDNTRELDVRSGAAQIADSIPYNQLATMREDHSVHLVVKQVSAVDPVMLNEHVKPLNEIVVRQALNYATPKETINRVAFANTAIPENSAIGIIKYWDKNIKPYPYDIAKAKELLAKSSAPHGFSIKLMIDGTDTPSKQTAAILQQAWAQIGVKVSIEETDYGTLGAKFYAENYQALLEIPTGPSSDVPADDELAQAFLVPTIQKSFFTFYNNPTVDRLVAKAISTPGEAKRRQLFAEIQQTAVNDPPFVFIVFAPGTAAVSNSITGFNFVTTNWFRLDEVGRVG
jgi:peptide/nickel transport system substrate-binding protein